MNNDVIINLSSSWQILGGIITISSLAFAIYQYRANVKSKNLILNESLGIHNNIALALGAVQSAKKHVIKEDVDNQNIIDKDNLIYELGRAEGFCNSLLHDSAKMYCNIGSKTLDNIIKEVDRNELNQDYKSIYTKYVKR